MRYRKLGQTGLVVSEICMGTMTFGGMYDKGIWGAISGQPQDEVNALMKTAVDAGVNFFDTADVYTLGESEVMLGQSIRDLGLRRDEIVVATKVHGRVGEYLGETPDEATLAEAKRRQTARNINGLSRKHIFDAVEASLDRLDMDYIDLYQVHGIDPLTPIEETVDALNDLVRSGMVRYVGLCNMSAWQIMKAVSYAEHNRLARFESCQMYYSIAGRDLEREVVPMAQDQNLAILPWSPLAGGFLSGKFSRDEEAPDGARRTRFPFPPIDEDRGWAVIDVMREVASAHDASVAQVALAWLLHQSHVTSVIIGARKMSQLEDNLGAVNLKLTANDMKKLDAVSQLPAEYPQWMLDQMGGDRASQVS